MNAKNIRQALGLPSTYRVIRSAYGHVDTVLNEIAELHSGTGGHVSVYARWTSVAGQWREIQRDEFLSAAVQLFGIEPA